MGESGEGVSRGTSGDAETKNVMENRCDKGVINLSDGVRVSEEFKGSVGSSSGSVISGSGWKGADAGSPEINDKHDLSKQRVVELMSRNNGWGSWGVMNLVGRVLEGKLSVDEEMEKNVINSESVPEVNLVPDTNALQGVVGERTSENGTTVDKDLDKLGSGYLNGKQDLVSSEMVPDGKLETREVDGVNADELIPEGHVESNGVNGAVLTLEGHVEMKNGDADVCGEVNDVNADVFISGGHVEVDNVSADVLKPGRVEVNNANAGILTPKGNVEVNGVNDDVLTPKGGEEHHRTEKGGEYCVSDLVWGKVRSHPWWPGQIFAPSAASDKAKKYFKRETHLVAYFGDQTFAWNEEAKINPFWMHFSQMEKQSSADGFCRAVDCALDEVSRRVNLGLSCPCLPQETRDKIKFQNIANAGIREESSKVSGGDSLSSAASFSPGELVQFLGSLAENPQSNSDRLQFVTKRAQLLAFNRWKGHDQLPRFEVFGELEDDTRSTVNRDGKDSQELMEELPPGPDSEGPNDFPSKKRKSTARGGSSRKPERLSGGEKCPKIKEKSISVLMSSSSSCLQSDDKKPAKRKIDSSAPSNSQVKRRKGLLSPSSSGGMASKGKTVLTVGESTGKIEAVEIIPAGIPTPDAILSELMLAAKKPLQRNGTILSVVGFLRELRNSACVQKSASKDTTEESLDACGLEGTKDSYWTDRIIQSYPQDHMLFEPKTPRELASKLETNITIDLDTESSEHSPTALILNFTNAESIPSVTNLNDIFMRYGPLMQSETKILSKSKRAKVIFRRRADAETAFSSAGKYSIFGPSLMSYRLNYNPTPRKSRATSIQNGKALL